MEEKEGKVIGKRRKLVCLPFSPSVKNQKRKFEICDVRKESLINLSKLGEGKSAILAQKNFGGGAKNMNKLKL